LRYQPTSYKRKHVQLRDNIVGIIAIVV